MTDGDTEALYRASGVPHIPGWLRNRHLQSIYPSFPLRRRGVERRSAALLAASEEWIIDCGAGVRLLTELASRMAATTSA